MEKLLMKTSLFGYSKASVCEYVAKLNEDFTRKLLGIMQDNEAKQQELQSKIASLEQENKRLRNEYDNISGAFLDARQYANNLRTMAEEENNNFRSANKQIYEEQIGRLKEFRDNINAVRDNLKALTESCDRDIRAQEEIINAVLQQTIIEEKEQ